TTNGGCTVFQPGMYTDIANNFKLGKDNYFVSGVYYFRNVAIDVKQTQIVGGKQDTGVGEQSALRNTPCASDPVGNTTHGVKWVLGGTSWINVENPSGDIELFNRT